VKISPSSEGQKHLKYDQKTLQYHIYKNSFYLDWNFLLCFFDAKKLNLQLLFLWPDYGFSTRGNLFLY